MGRLTELLRQHDFTVLRLSARKYHHLSAALSIEELALVLAAGIGEAAMETLGESQLPALAKQGVWERIAGSLEQVLRDRPDQTRDFLHGFVTDIAASLHPRQLVILVDDLEKYDVPTDRVAPVYTQMQELFFSASELLKLPSCHVVYTVPPYVALLNRSIKEKYDGNLHLLPSVKVRSRPPERADFAPGLSALETVISQRVDLDQTSAKRACGGC